MMATEIKVLEIASTLNASVHGDGDLLINGVNSIDNAGKGNITFATNSDNLRLAEQTEAHAVIVPENITESTKTILRVKDPKFAIAKILGFFHEEEKSPRGIHPTAVIGKDVSIDPTASIEAHCFIGNNCKVGKETTVRANTVIRNNTEIGEGCAIHPNVTIYPNCRIGNNVILHAGVVVGSDGFGYTEKNGIHHKVPQVGNVIIEDNVEVGANTTIDCATMGSTVIGAGTKIDNLVQIAHNNRIGQNCIIVALTGISGSVRIGNNVMIGGQVGFKDHVTVGDRAMIVATATVSHDLPGDQVYAGTPARTFQEQKRQWASIALLPEFMKKLKSLPSLIEKLQERIIKLESKIKS